MLLHNDKGGKLDFKDTSGVLFSYAASYALPCAGAGVGDKASPSAAARSAGLLYRPSTSKVGFSLREKAGEASSCTTHRSLSQPLHSALAAQSKDPSL